MEKTTMMPVLREILDAFYATLAKSDAIDDETINALRGLCDSGKKLRADDFVEIIAAEPKRPAQ